jgi:hypothetical protein
MQALFSNNIKINSQKDSKTRGDGVGGEVKSKRYRGGNSRWALGVMVLGNGNR